MTTLRKRRAPLRPILLSLALIGLLGWSWQGVQSCQSQQARSRIEQSLGAAAAPSQEALPPPESGADVPDMLDDPERQPMALPPSFPNPFGRGFASSFGDGMGSSDGVQMEETPSAYRLRVPLADKKDAHQIHLKVSDHHIEIAGQTGSAPSSGSPPGFSITTSFMQSLDTSQSVLPEKVRQELNEHDGRLTLLITIPKKDPGSKVSQQRLPKPNAHAAESLPALPREGTSTPFAQSNDPLHPGGPPDNIF